VYEIRYNNIVWPDSTHMLEWHMCNAFWQAKGCKHTIIIGYMCLFSTVRIVPLFLLIITLQVHFLSFFITCYVGSDFCIGSIALSLIVLTFVCVCVCVTFCVAICVFLICVFNFVCQIMSFHIWKC
jgi:hypothetical protein